MVPAVYRILTRLGYIAPMDQTRCPNCKQRLMAMTARTGRTELRCVKCEKVSPSKTVVAKWAPLAAAE
jgi:hypothetical protein